MACVLAFAAGAADIVFDSNPDGGIKGNNTQASGPDEISKDGVTISVSQGAFGCTGAAEGNWAYRLAKNSTTTIKSAQTITKIVFDCIDKVGSSSYGCDGFAAADGLTLSADNKTATWVGSATEVQLTASGHQVRATKITVTVGGEVGVSAPVFSVKQGTYYAPINVEITCSTTGANIKYSLNGGAEQTYSAPIAISSNTTLSAYAEKDGKKSTTTTATYEFATATDVASIAAYKVVDDGTKVRFTTGVTVLAQYNKSMYVTDGKDYMLVFGNTGQTYKNGDVIPAGFTGEKTTYNGEPELSVYETDNFQKREGGAAIEPELAQTVDIKPSYFGKLIYMPNVTISGINKSNFNIADGAGSIPGYNSMGAKLPTEAEAAATTYNITGIVGAYRSKDATETTYQVLPVKIEDVNGGGGGGETGDMTIAKFNELPDNTEVTFDGTVTVLAQQGNYLYVKDATGFMLVYGSTGQTYKMGDIIPSGFGGKKTTYNGEPELASPTGFQSSVSSETVSPETITVSGINHDNWGKYVLVKGVKLNIAEKTITDASGSIGYFDRFSVTFPADGTTCDVLGIVASYGKQTVYQLLPMDFPGVEVEVPEVATLAEAIGATTKVKLTGDLTVVYQNNRYLYVKDATAYTLIYGDLGKTYRRGDKIAGGAEYTWNASYNELVPVDASQLPDGIAGAKVEANEFALEEISQDMVNQYVMVPNCAITVADEANRNYTVNDGTLEMTMHNQFNGDYYDPDVEVPTEGTHTIYAFVSVYKGEIQLYPVYFDDDTSVADLNADKDVKGVRYYNLLGVESNEPFQGVNVVVTTYTDGTRSAKKVIK